MATATDDAGIKAALLELAATARVRPGRRKHPLTPYRDEIIAALDAGAPAEEVGALLSTRLRRKVSKDTVWRFGKANGARRKRHARGEIHDAELAAGNVTPIRGHRQRRPPPAPPEPDAPNAPPPHTQRRNGDEHAATRRAGKPV